MTLYWGYRENTCNQKFLVSNSIGKIENIVQISKSHKDKKSNYIYALVGNTLDVYCLGMLKEQTPKYKGKLFIGQKVYATSKEELCIYYREAVKRHRGALDAAMKKAEQRLTNLNSQTNTITNTYQYNWVKSEIERLKQTIKESEAQYKHLIERIKKL